MAQVGVLQVGTGYHSDPCVIGQQLLDQVQAWEGAAASRRYCDAAERRAKVDAEWLGWARAYADEIDPITHATVLPPEEQVPSDEQLKPFLPRQ